MAHKVRVLVVDDSPIYLEALSLICAEEGDIEIAGTASDGREAVRRTRELEPDVIVMDVQMPVMDGLDAVEEIMSTRPTPILLLTGDPARQGPRWSFEALSRGALDLRAKPTLEEGTGAGGRRFREHLRLLSTVPVVYRRRRAHHDETPASSPTIHAPPKVTPVVAAVVASTGGPAVLAEMVGALPQDLPVPVLLVQHLAAGFAPHLVEWLASGAKVRVELAEDRARPEAGTVYVAPHDHHLLVGAGGRLQLDGETPPLDGHRPSGTRLLESVARIHGPRAVGMVLTGMGADGAAGLRAMHEAGATCLAQDEATSTVFGMARAAVALDAVDRLVPRGELAAALCAAVQHEACSGGGHE